MKNFVLPAEVAEFASPRTVNAGDCVIVGSLFGVSMNNTVSGAVGQFVVRGILDLAKASGAVTLGALMYWDDTAKLVTTVSTSNKCIGVAVAPAASGDATARTMLGYAN